MKILIFIALTMISPWCFAKGLGLRYQKNTDGTYTINVPSILTGKWILIGRSSAYKYSIQLVDFVKYSVNKASQNDDHDVILKESINGPDGKVSQVELTYMTAVCGPGDDIPDSTPISGMVKFYVAENGMPGAPIDESFTIDVGNPALVPLVQGTVGAETIKDVCLAFTHHNKLP